MKLWCFVSVLSFFATRLSGFLVCILWSCFLFVVCLEFCFSCFLIPRKKDTENGHSKNQKKKNAEKRDNIFSVSAVVFANSVPICWGWVETNAFLLKTV